MKAARSLKWAVRKICSPIRAACASGFHFHARFHVFVAAHTCTASDLARLSLKAMRNSASMKVILGSLYVKVRSLSNCSARVNALARGMMFVHDAHHVFVFGICCHPERFGNGPSKIGYVSSPDFFRAMVSAASNRQESK